MTIKKNHLPKSPNYIPVEDDYYAVEKKRIAQDAQKAHRIHEEDVHLHLVANIPYYEDAPESVRRCLVLLNNVLLHRFDQSGLIYWDFFKKTPSEIRDYAQDFGNDLPEATQKIIITYLEHKKIEEENMIDIGFDEDGEEDIPRSKYGEVSEALESYDLESTDADDESDNEK